MFYCDLGALKGIFSRFGGRNTTTASKLSSEMDVCVTSGEEDNDDVTDQAPAQYSESACAEQTGQTTNLSVSMSL